MSFDGAVLNGVQYDAVERSKLTRRQRKQIQAVTMLAEASGVNVHFYQSRTDSKGRYQGANGGFRSGEGIFLDVNAGAYSSRSLSQVAIVRTAAHELTHFIQENSPAQYRELQDFLLTHLSEYQGKSLEEMVQSKLDRDTTGRLTYEQAIDEVVADGCEMMLRRTTVVETLARENSGLFNSIRRWLHRWAARISDAFEGVEAAHDEARAMEGYLEQLQDIWDRAFVEAARNGGYSEFGIRNSENERAADSRPYEERTTLQGRTAAENKNAARKSDAIKFSSREKVRDMDIPWDADDRSSIKTQVKRALPVLNKKQTVVKVTYDSKTDNYREMLDSVLRTRFGYKISRQDGVSFLFDKTAIGIIGHYVSSDAEAAAAIAAPYVLKRGDIISGHKHHNGGLYPSLTFAAPVELNGKRGIETVVVLFADKDRVHALRITGPDGSNFTLPTVEKETAPEMEGVGVNAPLTRPTGVASNNSIRDSTEKSNTGLKKSDQDSKLQDRDAAPTDRELLMEAAETPRASVEVKDYAQKVKAMERAQAKLERRRAALEALERENSESENGRTADSRPYEGETKAQAEKLRGEIGKLEAQVSRYEKALKKAEQTPGLKRAAEKGLAAWREANPEEAARNLRALREENKALQEYVEYYRREARRTEPGQETLLPEDVRRMARALLQQTNSQADASAITQRRFVS